MKYPSCARKDRPVAAQAGEGVVGTPPDQGSITILILSLWGLAVATIMVNIGTGVSVEGLLRSVVGTGEIVTVVYNGGSHPGQPRKIVPVALRADEIVIAEPGVDLHKHYKLNKIASVELGNGTRADNPQAIHDPEPSAPALDSLSQYAEHFGPELRATGWNVISTDTELAIGGYFKNGKPRRSTLVSVNYREPTEDPGAGSHVSSFEIAFVAGMEDSLRTHPMADPASPHVSYTRPWRVDSPRLKQGRTFKDIRAAVSLFIDEVRACKLSDT